MSDTVVVFEVFSDDLANGGVFGVDMAILASAVIRVLRQQGVNAHVSNVGGSKGEVWARNYAAGVPEATAEILAAAEVWLRAWPDGAWPSRPSTPRVVVDFVRHAAERSRASDFVVAFDADGTNIPELLAWDVLNPVPVESNMVARSVVPSKIVIHLGQDSASRLVGIKDAINGFAGMTAVGLRYPEEPEDDGDIHATAEPWTYYAEAETVVANPEFPFRLAGAMGIPGVLVAASDAEDDRAQELIERAHASFFYAGKLADVDNDQIRDFVRDIRNDMLARKLLKVGGVSQRWSQGVKRITDWVGRELVGQGLFKDPFQIQGFDTVIDPYNLIPVNAESNAALIIESGGGAAEGAEVDVQVFTIDGTWSKPDGAKMVHVEMIAGGNGGGSGERNSATIHGGGGGGAGGLFREGWFHADALPPTVAVVVGQGGAGGVGVLVDSTPGNDGTPGGDSEFGDFLAARNEPEDRTTPVYPFDAAWPIAGTGGNSLGTTPPYASIPGECGFPGVHKSEFNLDDDLNFMLNLQDADLAGFVNTWSGNGGVGGNGDPTFNAGAGSDGGKRGAGGGGGGGGITGADVGEDGGAGGAGSLDRGVPLAGGSAGLAPQQDGGTGASAEGFIAFGGGGGGGGDSSDPTVAGQGGAGGFPGGGGGGGAASLNGVVSGAGGQGGNGLVVVTSYF